jgi:hypothetical protein
LRCVGAPRVRLPAADRYKKPDDVARIGIMLLHSLPLFGVLVVRRDGWAVIT